MRRLSATFLLVLLSVLQVLCTSSATTSKDLPRVKRDSLDSIPPGWKLHHEPTANDHTITLQIALKQHNFESLAQTLDEVSNPDHERYGKYLTKEEVEELVRPHPDSLMVVEEWLKSNDIDLASASRSPAKDWIFVTVPVALAASLLETEYGTFIHPRFEHRIIRATAYSLPVSIADHIDFIQPADTLSRSMSRRRNVKRFSQPQIRSSGASDHTADVCADDAPETTPACLAYMYHFDNYKPRSTKKNQIGVVTYLGDFLMNSDLQQFYQKYKPDAVNTTFTVQSVAGGKTSTNFTASEAALDIQYAAALTFPTPVVSYSVGSTTENGDQEGFLTWALYVLNQTNPPQVFSTSYADTESSISRDYAIRVCNTFAQLGARGISVIFGSGDGGVDNDVHCQDVTNTTKFEPSFPGGCPYLTSVGGTFGINPEIGVGGPESAANYRGSGAGFSNYFARPAWQDKAVSTYLKTLGSTYKGLYNNTGRAFPDIAAQSSNFAIVENGEITADSGTSASGPVVAAIVSLLNDYRISNGQPPLGFLNPWLYSKGYQGLNDILKGQSEGCIGRGFNASTGWDPVTGLGTPDFAKLQKLI